jgi:hypothetical protein
MPVLLHPELSRYLHTQPLLPTRPTMLPCQVLLVSSLPLLLLLLLLLLLTG